MRKVFYALIISMLWSAPSQANTSDWATSDHSRTRLLSAVESIGKIQNFEAGLEAVLLNTERFTRSDNISEDLIYLPPSFKNQQLKTINQQPNEI